MKTIQQNINNEWRFDYGEHIGIEQSQCFDNLYSVGLPHSFGAPYYGDAEFFVGYGVYAKTIFVDKQFVGKRICVEFGAVFQVADIFLNGNFVVRHEGGYTAFLADLTNFVKEGDNVLVVRVNNLWSPIIAPRAGEHTFCGGIYRDVQLIISDIAHIGWYGLSVTTDICKDGAAQVAISVDTVNAQGMTLTCKIVSPQGKVVAEVAGAIEAGVDKFTYKASVVVDKPQLWSCDTPYLYTLTCQLGCADEALEDESKRYDCDSAQTTFGIRAIEWTRDKGFFLNGKHLLLQGANVHQDHGGWGDAVTRAGIFRDVKMMKECGMNFIRGSHYPHHTAFADECDRQGILLWSEGVFWGIGGFCDEGFWDSSAMPTKKEDFDGFESSLKSTMLEMVKTNRNHPSIIVWSIGNEMFFSKREVMKDAKALAMRMVDFTHSIDPTRKVALGGVQREGFDTIGDVAGYNGDGATLFLNPKLPSMVAEYGSVASYRPGKESLCLTKGADDFYEWRAGRAVWCGFHHGSIANIGNLGIVDLYRLPLRAWYAYREKYRGIAPAPIAKKGIATQLKIVADKLKMSSDGTDDIMLVIEALNAQGERISCDIAVELTVLDGGGILPTGRSMTFCAQRKNFFDGVCAIEFRSYYAGKTTVEATAEGLVSAKICIDVDGDIAYDGREIVAPQQPPCQKRKLSKGADIVANRPIVTSSEFVKGSSARLSDCDNKTLWRPQVDDKLPTVEIDLENKYDNFEMFVQFKKSTKGLMSISVSNDKKEWRNVEDITMFKFKRKYCVGVNIGEYRFARLQMRDCHDNTFAITHIKAWQK